MADTVRGIMEGMVPELEDYVARGYFSDREVSSIIQNRQKFEYALRRRNADKQDFLRYCEYEWKLEQLRQLRRKAKEITGKRSLADYGIVRRIHFIYDRATRKFKGDVAIWMTWLQFCKESNSKRQVSKVVTKALKLHPCAPYFWAYAAAWEFEGNSNPAAARQLLQSGLRHCPSDGSLWVEYFRMELLYANKLKARRKVLGLDDQDAEGAPQAPVEGSPADKVLLQGKLASVVHKTAVGKLPHNADMRLNMLRAVSEVAIESPDDLKRTIVSSFVEDLGDDGSACCKLATAIEQGLTPQLGSGLESACAFLKERITATEDAQLQQEAVDWASSRIIAADEQGLARVCPDSGAVQSVWAVDGSGTMKNLDQERNSGKPEDASCCEQLCEWIIQCADITVHGGCSEDVTAKKVQALLRSGHICRATDELKQVIQDRSRSVVLWHAALRMSVASVGAKGTNEGANFFGYNSLTDLVSAALKSTKGVSGSEALIPQSVACLAAMKEPLDTVTKPMLDSLATASVNCGGQHVAQVLEAIWLLKGKAAGIALAETVAAMPSPGIEFWAMYAQLRIQCACLNASNKVARKDRRAIHEVFERAVQIHGHDSDIWLQWIRFLETTGGEEAVQITQRAVAALPAKAADSLTLRLRES